MTLVAAIFFFFPLVEKRLTVIATLSSPVGHHVPLLRVDSEQLVPGLLLSQ